MISKAENKEESDYNKALIRPAENKSLFDKAARRYDLMNKVISLGMDSYWRGKAIDSLGPVESGYYVDAGCGTGDILIDIAKRFPLNCPRLSGIDQSSGMLEIAEKKLGKLGISGSIEIKEGDALKLPFSDDCANGIINAFVFRNLDDRMAALKEWHRVLKPGGRCVILELSKPDNPLLLAGYKIYTGLFVPLAAALLSRVKDYQYLIESISSFPSQDLVLKMMSQAGYTQVNGRALSGGVVRIYSGTK